MPYELSVLMSDVRQNPRAGVLVELRSDETKQRKRTGSDGVAPFEIASETRVSVEVEGQISVQVTPAPGGEVELIGVALPQATQPTLRRAIPVMIRCPGTGGVVPTGLGVASAAEFKMKEFTRNSVKCAVCGEAHFWSTSDAFLEERGAR
jgi:hypothetical protein